MSSPGIPAVTMTELMRVFFAGWRRPVAATLPEPVVVPPTAGPAGPICPVFRIGSADPSSVEALEAARPRESPTDLASSFTPGMIRGAPGGTATAALGCGYLETEMAPPQPGATPSIGKNPLREQLMTLMFHIWLPVAAKELLRGPYSSAIAAIFRNLRLDRTIFEPLYWTEAGVGIDTIDQVDSIPAEPSQVGIRGEYELSILGVPFRRRHFAA